MFAVITQVSDLHPASSQHLLCAWQCAQAAVPGSEAVTVNGQRQPLSSWTDLLPRVYNFKASKEIRTHLSPIPALGASLGWVAHICHQGGVQAPH